MAQQAPAENAKPPKRTEKVVCKSFPVTGFLVNKYRACKPQREWEREREAITQGQGVSDACRDRGNGGSLCGL